MPRGTDIILAKEQVLDLLAEAVEDYSLTTRFV
jgi:hypothetical protein